MSGPPLPREIGGRPDEFTARSTAGLERVRGEETFFLDAHCPTQIVRTGAEGYSLIGDVTQLVLDVKCLLRGRDLGGSHRSPL
jgi:hypothetical protein